MAVRTLRHDPTWVFGNDRPKRLRSYGDVGASRDLAIGAQMTSCKLEGSRGVVDLMEAAAMLGVGRTLAYQLVRDGGWPTPVIRVGRLIKIPVQPLRDYLDGRGVTQS